MQEDDIILEDSLCPVKLDLRLVRRLDLLLKASRQWAWYSELKYPKTFLKYFIMPGTIISLTVTHNSIKGLLTWIAMCCLVPAWQCYYTELVPSNRADKARCHPCQHTSCVWGNSGTRWLKEILLLPNTDWQQRRFKQFLCFKWLSVLNESSTFCLSLGPGQFRPVQAKDLTQQGSVMRYPQRSISVRSNCRWSLGGCLSGAEMLLGEGEPTSVLTSLVRCFFPPIFLSCCLVFTSQPDPSCSANTGPQNDWSAAGTRHPEHDAKGRGRN